MKKKFLIIIFMIILMIIGIYLIPVKEGKKWVNDDEIYDIGHYENVKYNIFGMEIYAK